MIDLTNVPLLRLAAVIRTQLTPAQIEMLIEELQEEPGAAAIGAAPSPDLGVKPGL